MSFIGELEGGEFFAAANTERGFVSYFDELFFGKHIERRYIIKGGPGTGKSTLMKRCAERARAAGREVTTYFCSSDTLSVDGIVIDGRVAVLDGTAPHSYDTVLPGARDDIIDLGRFWNSGALSKRAEELSSLLQKKRGAYSLAYGYLRAAGEAEGALYQMMSECVMTDKLVASVGRFCDRCFGIRHAEGAAVLHRQVSAFGVHSRVHLPTLCDAASARYTVVDHYGTARIYMAELLRSAEIRGQRTVISHGEVCSKVPNEMYFPDTGVYVTVSYDREHESDALINMKRFTNAESIARVRRYYRVARRASETLTDVAERQLVIAGEAHAESEKIYGTAMDFEALRQYTDEVIEKILIQ